MSKQQEMPSNIWYLVPIFFSILGGIIAYLACKDKDELMANVCLGIGVMVLLFDMAVVWYYVLRFL